MNRKPNKEDLAVLTKKFQQEDPSLRHYQAEAMARLSAYLKERSPKNLKQES